MWAPLALGSGRGLDAPPGGGSPDLLEENSFPQEDDFGVLSWDFCALGQGVAHF